MLSPADLMLRWRSRAVWSDPVRKVLTLESFSRTEADGGKDIGSAATRVSDEELRGHLARHTEDELRHADLFLTRAKELRATTNMPPEAGAEASGDSYDLSRGRPSSEVDAHGFFTSGLLDEMGEVACVAMLHGAEVRAASLFSAHRDLTKDDPETCAVFEKILRDEQYHVAYTKATLDRWVAEGRGREVAEARSAARGGRFWSGWKRTGIRSGASFSQVVLRVMYFTILLPFGMANKGSKTATGWSAPRSQAPAGEGSKAAASSLSSQY
ncbi:MAG: hypothetical protein ACI9EF_002117 [Pseudohongiellaceae bacterium]|jgi:hypothetical protein